MPLQILAEKTRQALGVSSSSSFQPISLERYQHALADADSFAAWLRDYQGHLQDVRGALQVFFSATSDAVGQCPLPSLYSERYDTHELRALPRPPPPKGYAHLFNIQGSASPTPGSSAAGVSGGDAGAQLAQLPGAFSDKFEGHVMVPIDLWLQAYKEGQARLAALDKLRDKVDAQRSKLHKQGQQFEKKQQERKQRTNSHSNRSSFEIKPQPAHWPTVGTTAAAAGLAPAEAAVAGSPASLAAAAAAVLAAQGNGQDGSDATNSSGSCARPAADAGILHTPPCSPMVTFTGFATSPAAAAAAVGSKGVGQHYSTAESAGPGAGTGVEGFLTPEGDSGADGYVEGLVRLRSHPLADAPTSVASSGNSRRNSNEQQPQRPTVHAALPVGGASGPAAAGVGSTVVGDAVSGAAGAAVAASNAAGNQAAATQGAASERGGAGFAGIEDDEESWAAAVLHRRHGDQGLLQAHEMVERALGPLLSEFSKAEMQLSTLLGWLVTQAVRLRGYLNHMLLTSATAVDAWALPPGLLEPFPADVLLNGDSGSHFNKSPARLRHSRIDSPAGPTPPELAQTRTHTHSGHTHSTARHGNRSRSPQGGTAGGTSGRVQGSSTESGSTGEATTAAAHGTAALAAGRASTKYSETAASSAAAAPPAAGVTSGTVPSTSVAAGLARIKRDAAAADDDDDMQRTAATETAGASKAPTYTGSPAAAAAAAAESPVSSSAAESPLRSPAGSKPLPQPSSTSNVSIGSAVLAAMVRSLSWKSSGQVSGPGMSRASRTSSGASGPSLVQASRTSSGPGMGGAASRTSSGTSSGSSNAAAAAGAGGYSSRGVQGPLGEGVLAVSPRGKATLPDTFAAATDTAVATPAAAPAGPTAALAFGDAAQTASVAAVAVSSADMRYLAHDQALIQSLSNKNLYDTNEENVTSDSYDCPAGAPPAAAAAGGDSRGAVTGEGVDAFAASAAAGSLSSLSGGGAGTGHMHATDGLPHIGTGSSIMRGHVAGSAAAASERAHKRQQLLQRAAELDTEAAAHSAAAVEAGRMAEGFGAEGSQWEAKLRVEVTEEKTRLVERHQAIMSELSQLEGSGGVSRLRESAADLDRQLREVRQQGDELAAQEKAVGGPHARLLSRRAATESIIRELEAKRGALQQQLAQAQSELERRMEAAGDPQKEVSVLQQEVSAAEARKADAQSSLPTIAAEAAEGVRELSSCDSKLLGHRAALARLQDTELPPLLTTLTQLQDRVHKLRQSHGRVRGELSEVEHALQLGNEEVAHWEATLSSMTSRVSELSALGDGLSCESATHNAKAVAARGLQKAEETRAAAAGAEAEALKAAAAAMAHSLSAAAFTSTTSTSGRSTAATAVGSTTASSLDSRSQQQQQQQQQQLTTESVSALQGATAADAGAADRLSDSSSSLAPAATGTTGLGHGTALSHAAPDASAAKSPADNKNASAAPTAAAPAAAPASAAAAVQSDVKSGIEADKVPNRLAAAGPLQNVAGLTASVAVAPAEEQQLSSSDTATAASAAGVDSSTQTPKAVIKVSPQEARDRSTITIAAPAGGDKAACTSGTGSTDATAAATVVDDSSMQQRRANRRAEKLSKLHSMFDAAPASGPLAYAGEEPAAAPPSTASAGAVVSDVARGMGSPAPSAAAAVAAPAAFGGVLTGAGGARPRLGQAAAVGGVGVDGRSNPQRHVVPASRAHVVSDIVPSAGRSDQYRRSMDGGAAAAAAALTVPPAVTAVGRSGYRGSMDRGTATAAAAVTVPPAVTAAAGGGYMPAPAAAAARPAALTVPPAMTAAAGGGYMPAPAAAAARPAAAGPVGREGDGVSVPASPASVAASVASMGSLGSHRRQHKSSLRHFKPQPSKREENIFHLPLAGMDVDITHLPDQAQGLPPQRMTDSAAAVFGQSGPTGMQYGSGGYNSYEPADGAGPLGGREARRRSMRRQSSAGSSTSSMLAAAPAAAAGGMFDNGGILAAAPGGSMLAAPAAAAGGMSRNVGMLAAAPAGASYEGREEGLLWGSLRHRSSKGQRSSRPTDALQSEGVSYGVTQSAESAGMGHGRGAVGGAGQPVSWGSVGPSNGYAAGVEQEQATQHVRGPMEAAGGRWGMGSRKYYH